jgi:hypothetical protein
MAYEVVRLQMEKLPGLGMSNGSIGRVKANNEPRAALAHVRSDARPQGE